MGLLDSLKQIFRKKSPLRPGALKPAEVKRRIQEIGPGKVVEIIRIGYDGEIDDIPLIMQIIEVRDDYFTGKIINPERDFIEKNSSTLVYARRGGGVIEYSYADGDIKDIILSRDEEILQNAKNLEELKELLTAIEINDPVLICFWDKNSHGTINAHGKLIHKDMNQLTFSIQIDSINFVELEQKQVLDFDLKKDLVIDLQYAD